MTAGFHNDLGLAAVDFDPFAGPALTCAASTTHAQREIWTATRMGDDASLAFNESVSLSLSGELDVDALRSAMRDLIARHEALRTTFSSDGLTLVVAATAEHHELVCHDLTTLSDDAERQSWLAARLRCEVETPFSLERGPLFRAQLVRMTPREHVLVLTAHHIVCDGWSTAVVLSDLAALYGAATRNAVPELRAPVPFSAFARAQEHHATTAEHLRDEAYWLLQFDGPTPVLSLPTDKPRPAIKTYASRREDIGLPATLVERLKKTGARRGCSFFAVLLSAFEVLLHRLSGGQDDIVVAIPAAGQATGEYAGLVGHCVSTLPIRAHIDGSLPFTRLLEAQRKALLDALEHQSHTLGSLLEKLPQARDASRPPLAQILFNLDQPLSPEALRWDGLKVSFAANPRSFENFELFVNAVETDGAVVFEVQYNADLFAKGTVRRWFRSLQVLLEAIATDPDTKVSALPVLSPAERAEQIAWNDTAKQYPGELCAHELIERQVDLSPFATAVVSGTESIGYRDLDSRANRLARRLRTLGVTKDVLVGLYFERSIDMVVALLAVLKAGGAYVPLDPAFPRERIAFMVSDARLGAIVTQRSLVDTLPSHQAQVLVVEDAHLENESHARLERQSAPESLAYVIYTSGSTGKPKGVELPHRAVVNFLTSVAREPGLDASDVLLAVTTLSFDIAVLELYLPLIVGARVVLATRDMAAEGSLLLEAIRRHGVTAMQATPSTWRLLIGAGWSKREPLKVLCGGEPLPADLARALVERAPVIWNMYGPTETTVWSTMQRIDSTTFPILIGRPLANTRVHVVDAAMQPLPVGVAGELCIGGDGLARGYLGRPELTGERFVPDPFDPQLRVYRTGDIVRRLPSGELEYIGRNDQQVKLRGYRIELGEIETALTQHPDVAEAVAVVREVAPGDSRLVAYLVMRASAPLDEDTLRAHLRTSLPEYMVPQHLVALGSLPLTPNGKIDRKALPAIPGIGGSTAANPTYVAPRSKTEHMLAEVWAHALGVGRVSVDDDFFRLGGHSLLAAQVLSRLARDHGVALSLRRMFEAPTVAKLAVLVDAHARDAGTEALTIPRRSSSKPARQSFMQQRLWFLEQMEPQQTAYNLPSAFRLHGRLDIPALERSLAAIVQRHESLRTTLADGEHEPVQVVAPSLVVKLPVIDVAETDLRARIQAQANVPFDLSRGPLFVATLYRLRDDEHVFFFMPHHAIWDGWSFDAFLNELETHYAAFSAGHEVTLAAPPIQYADFSEWHLDWLRGEELEKQATYWKQKLAGDLSPLDMPTDHPRPRVLSGRGGFEPLALTREERDALTAVGRSSGATLYMVMLAAFFTLLHRYTGKSDLLVGTPIRGRTQPQTEDLLGFFVNTLVVRADLSREPTFRELLARVRAGCLEDFAHPDMPFEVLLRELKVPRDLSTTPLFQALFSFQDASVRKDTLGDLGVTQLHVMPDAAQTELTLWVMDRTDGMLGGISYSTDLFRPETIQRLILQLRTLLASVARDPEVSIATIPILPDAEVVLLDRWNDTARPFPRDLCAHDLIERHAAQTPDAIAVVYDEASLTYGELDARANRLARRLRGVGVRRDVLVGLCVERSLEMVVALLAILKAGGAYVPLDPGLPEERLALMAEDAKLGVLVTSHDLTGRVSAPNARHVLVEDDAPAESGAPLPKDEDAAAPSSTAYVIYTSGSTGRPKGCLVRHGGLVNLLTALAERPGFTKNDIALATATLSFDMAVAEIYVPLSVGAPVVIASRETAKDGVALLELLRRTGANRPANAKTVVHGTPATFRILLDAGWGPGLGIRAICGGEALAPDLARALTERADEVWNGYGPTETTVYTTFSRIEREVLPILIGSPIANVQCHVLDAHMQRVPIGAPGELYIGGAGVARSYLGLPELTAARFVRDPFASEAGREMYKTGDVVRWLACGALEHLGRNDNQVKVRGFRIELGEIEARLVEHPSVANACVLVVRYAEDDARLVAYHAAAAGHTVTRTDLRRHLRRVLPDYMVPHAFVELAALPRLANGKIDRKALPSPFEDARPEAVVLPRTDSERLVAEVWRDLLRVREIGVHDNFFNLGGHSLLVLRAVALIEKRAGIRPSPRSFVLDTLEQFAAQLSPPPPSRTTRILDKVTRGILG